MGKFFSGSLSRFCAITTRILIGESNREGNMLKLLKCSVSAIILSG
ncbi:MAG: BMP family ABC transporter substrate-binding protein, partial [Mesorhizobium sp.]